VCLDGGVAESNGNLPVCVLLRFHENVSASHDMTIRRFGPAALRKSSQKSRTRILQLRGD
ncbi:MAG: hypothetical protein ACJ8JD_10150, partial [Chthoniobacterales bacterium]